MPVTEDLVFFLAALALSIVSSVVLSRDVDMVGRRARLPEPAVGLLTALAADSPEISTAVVALLAGRHSVGAGVVVGSNLYNLAALLGLSAVVAGRVEVRRPALALNGVAALAVAGIAAAQVFGMVSGVAALGLVLAVVLPYVALSSVRSTQLRAVLPAGRVRSALTAVVDSSEAHHSHHGQTPPARREDLLSMVPALASVALASVAMVHTLTDLGDRYAIPDEVIGFLILATVTGIPNLVAAVRLARAGRGAAVVSEGLNSNTINIVVGLVVPALVTGLGTVSGLTRVGAVWLVGLTAGTVVLAAGGGLSRLRGGLVIAGYLAFVGVVVAGVL